MNHNTREGIAAQLGSYATFYAIMRLRNERGSDKTQSEEYSRLTPFTVLGRYRSDEFGHCWRLNRQMFTDIDRVAMSPVMTDEEFQTYFNQHVRPRISFYSTYEGIIGTAPAFPLPPPHLVCAQCGGTWELEQCHDIDVEDDLEDFDLSLFVGKTLREVALELTTRTDALRVFGHPLRVRNQQKVDPSADEHWATPDNTFGMMYPGIT